MARLGDRDARPVARRALRAGEPAAAAADHDQIPGLRHVLHRAEAARADVILDSPMAWILLLALAALAAAVAAAARRGLANLQGSREEAWAALEAQLEKRHAHMIQIVGLCARLMKYERDTLDRVTTSGSAVIAAARRGNMPALAAADKTYRAAARGAVPARGELPAIRDQPRLQGAARARADAGWPRGRAARAATTTSSAC